MTYLLDSLPFSDLMGEHPGVQRRLASLAPDDRVLVCPIVRGELIYGILR